MFSLFIRRDGLIDPPAMGRTDAHCHVLPGIDDGPKDDLGALAIARLLCEMGVQQIVATPHVISDLYPNSSAKILGAVEKLNKLLSASGLAIDVVAGAEYYAESELLSRIEQRDLLAFGEEKYVLFESPVENQPMILEEIGFRLQSAGYTPLLAHVERYRYLQGDFDAVEHLRKIGIRFQVNHPSFHLPKTSHRGEMARKLYVKGLVDVLGTDMHRATPWDRPSSSAELRAHPRSRLGR
jgi:tyrosine-protein phosphatase YwqE